MRQRTDRPLSNTSITGMPSIHTKQNKDLPFGIFRNKRLLAPYHDVAASVFRNNKSANLDEIFLASARDGDYDRIQTLVRPHDQSSMNIDVKDRRYGNSAVIWAAKRGHIKILQLLLKHGADVTLRNYDNKTALDEASPGIQQILVATVTSGGSSPRRLMQAAWQGNSHAVEQILSERKVIDINCQNADGMTPLLLAACDLSLFEKIGSLLTNYDPVRVVSLLLQHRADPSACDSEGRTSLHHAAVSKASAALNLIGLILGSGASIEKQDKKLFRALHCACQSGSAPVITRLIAAGANCNARAFGGTTPLHITAYSGHAKFAELLLEGGADPMAVDSRGLAPADVAKSKRVRNLLRSAVARARQQILEQQERLSPLKTPARFAGKSELDAQYCHTRQTRASCCYQNPGPLEDGTDSDAKVPDSDWISDDSQSGSTVPITVMNFDNIDEEEKQKQYFLAFGSVRGSMLHSRAARPRGAMLAARKTGIRYSATSGNIADIVHVRGQPSRLSSTMGELGTNDPFQTYKPLPPLRRSAPSRMRTSYYVETDSAFDSESTDEEVHRGHTQRAYSATQLRKGPSDPRHLQRMPHQSDSTPSSHPGDSSMPGISTAPNNPVTTDTGLSKARAPTLGSSVGAPDNNQLLTDHQLLKGRLLKNQSLINQPLTDQLLTGQLLTGQLFQNVGVLSPLQESVDSRSARSRQHDVRREEVDDDAATRTDATVVARGDTTDPTADPVAASPTVTRSRAAIAETDRGPPETDSADARRRGDAASTDETSSRTDARAGIAERFRAHAEAGDAVAAETETRSVTDEDGGSGGLTGDAGEARRGRRRHGEEGSPIDRTPRAVSTKEETETRSVTDEDAIEDGARRARWQRGDEDPPALPVSSKPPIAPGSRPTTTTATTTTTKGSARAPHRPQANAVAAGGDPAIPSRLRLGNEPAPFANPNEMLFVEMRVGDAAAPGEGDGDASSGVVVRSIRRRCTVATLSDARSHNSVRFVEIKDDAPLPAPGEEDVDASTGRPDLRLTTTTMSLVDAARVESDAQPGAVMATSPEFPARQQLSDSSSSGGSISRSNTASSSSSVSPRVAWKKGNLLGRGAFGMVWCGLTSLGELIAVKQIEFGTETWDKAQQEYERIQEEVELLKTLNHRNIVGYLGTSLDGNVVNIFMQFVPGGSLAGLLARFGALEESVFCHYTRQILEGVEYLHSNNVIHRDIKGGNIMLMPNGIVKVIDFGCAKKIVQPLNLQINCNKEILKSMKGTPYWMAPEVINGTGYGKKSDIWSIGCTIFEMATGKPPWAEMLPISAIFYIGSGQAVLQIPEKLSSVAQDFIRTCMTRDQDTRPEASVLLLHSFVKGKYRKSSGKARHRAFDYSANEEGNM